MRRRAFAEKIPTRFDDVETWRLFRETLTELAPDDREVLFAIGYTDKMIARLEKERKKEDAH